MTVGILQMKQVPEARLYWPEVRAELEAIRARCDETWMPDDIWAEVLTGSSYLWAAGEPGALEAFVILQIMTSTYDRTLHIWGAAERTIAKAADYWPQILLIAAEANCTHVTIESPRRWDRALPGATLRYLYSFKVE